MLSASPVLEPILAVAKVLETELGLPVGSIMVGLENWVLPKDKAMYIALFYGPESVISNTSQSDLNGSGDFVEVQEAVMLHHIDLDVMSFSSAARTGKEKVLWALASVAAQEAMELYGMRIASIPDSFTSVPSLEETGYLNRFRSTFAVNAIHRNIKPVPYYDTITDPIPVPDA